MTTVCLVSFNFASRSCELNYISIFGRWFVFILVRLYYLFNLPFCFVLLVLFVCLLVFFFVKKSALVIVFCPKKALVFFFQVIARVR